MKTFLLFLAMIFLTEPILLAQIDTLSKSSNYELGAKYLKKSKSQKTIGWVMVGAGTALIIAGAATNSSSSDTGWESLNTDVNQGILITSGCLVGLGSIPLFIAGRKNRKKAEIYLKPATALNYIQQKPAYSAQLGLIIRL
ncbi:hypothetical protein [Solitalea canadensis]|uniref:Uncharacterized protein n=1 Tax=Solitalea canadensis (strain ATCC 29591 / DSM 3403 / JCM 21819 / LMG 8368 / NBRC 15130 / NCIMB 12057 / USAM 9D) TaxID=929556 RepID=H8KRF0_SOLCM|nr:hypothetical protein [Solitalea canadensis]AFD07475.1 hypothetical protein Solca_2434 [Solitalea canadensis DSM 3403]